MNERKPIEIDVELNEGDFWRVSFAGRVKRFLLITLIYLPIALLIMYFVAFGAGANPFSEKNWSIIIVLFIICAIPFVFLPAVYFSLESWRRNLQRHLKKHILLFLKMKSKQILFHAQVN